LLTWSAPIEDVGLLVVVDDEDDPDLPACRPRRAAMTVANSQLSPFSSLGIVIGSASRQRS
jgi:hypothetical protein